MRNFKIRPAAFFLLVFSVAHNRLKNPSTAVIATKYAIAMRSEQKFFFAKKLPDLAYALNKLMQLNRVTDEHSH